MTYDFNGYEQSKLRRGSPDDIACNNVEQEIVEEGCDLSPVAYRKDVGTKIFNSMGGIDLTKLVPNVKSW